MQSLKLYLIEFLDLQSIMQFQMTCKAHHKLVDNKLWFRIVIRDYAAFLNSDPARDEDFLAVTLDMEEEEYNRIMSEKIQTEQENTPSLDEISFHFNPKKAHLKTSQLIYSEKENWKQKYKEFRQLPKFSGIWIGTGVKNLGIILASSFFFIGDYRTHGKEFLKLTQEGYILRALKLSGK